MSTERNFLSYPVQALGATPGMWPEWLSGSKALGLTTIPAAYLLGRYAAAPIARRFMPELEDEENYKDFSSRLGNIGALGTAGGWLGFAAAPEWRHLNQNSSSFGESLGNYLGKSWYTKSGSLFGSYEPVPKAIQDPTNIFAVNPQIAADQWAQTYGSSSIPVNHSIRLLAADPVLNPNQKNTLINVVVQANQNQPTGLISIQDVVRTAIDTGVGAFTGMALGKILALPTRSQTLLSRIGAVGNFLISTGIVGLN